MEEEKKIKDVKKKNKTSEVIATLENKIKELEEETLRAKADLINYRKRKDEEVSSMLKYASKDVFLDLLPVIDNFERAILLDDDKLTDEVSNFLIGFKMIYTNMKDILEKYGVKEIECLGEKFDANKETSVFMDSDPNYEDEIVLDVLQKGYTYNDKLLRSASVKINKVENINNEIKDKEGNDKDE